MKICSVDGCDSKVQARGMCNKHYRRTMKWGDPLMTKRDPDRGCSVEGCTEKHFTHGMCIRHYGFNRRNGDPLKMKRDPNRICSEDGCKTHAGTSGLCSTHLIKKWNDDNREHRHQRDREYYKKNREVIRVKARRYDAEHREERIARDRRYSASPKGKASRARAAAKRRKKLDVAEKFIWTPMRFCFFCGIEVFIDHPFNDHQRAVMDHYFPLDDSKIAKKNKKYGGHQPNNIVTACNRCNCRKQNKDPFEFTVKLQMEELFNNYGLTPIW